MVTNQPISPAPPRVCLDQDGSFEREAVAGVPIKMKYSSKLIKGIRWQFRKKSIARVFREIIRDMWDAVRLFFVGMFCVIVSPIFFSLAAPIRIAVWMLSPFLAPIFMKVPDSVWVKIGAISRKEGE